MFQLPGKGVTAPVIPVHGIWVKVEIWLNNAKIWGCQLLEDQSSHGARDGPCLVPEAGQDEGELC